MEDSLTWKSECTRIMLLAIANEISIQIIPLLIIRHFNRLLKGDFCVEWGKDERSKQKIINFGKSSLQKILTVGHKSDIP